MYIYIYNVFNTILFILTELLNGSTVPPISIGTKALKQNSDGQEVVMDANKL